MATMAADALARDAAMIMTTTTTADVMITEGIETKQ